MAPKHNWWQGNESWHDWQDGWHTQSAGRAHDGSDGGDSSHNTGGGCGGYGSYGAAGGYADYADGAAGADYAPVGGAVGAAGADGAPVEGAVVAESAETLSAGVAGEIIRQLTVLSDAMNSQGARIDALNTRITNQQQARQRAQFRATVPNDDPAAAAAPPAAPATAAAAAAAVAPVAPVAPAPLGPLEFATTHGLMQGEMIRDRWMIQHPNFFPPDLQWTDQPPPPPPPGMQCSHGHPEWFGFAYDPAAYEATYFVSARDIANRDHHGWDPLMRKTQSLNDKIFLPYSRCGNYSLLYTVMRDRPTLMIGVHMTGCGGNYYVSFACSACGRMTDKHQPQHEVSNCSLNPEGLTARELKSNSHVMASFRAFIGNITGMMEMTQPQMCRFLHHRNPALTAGMPALPAPTAAMPALPAPHGWNPGAGPGWANPGAQPNIAGTNIPDPAWLPQLDSAATPMVANGINDPIGTLTATDYQHIPINTDRNGLADDWSALAADNFGPDSFAGQVGSAIAAPVPSDAPFVAPPILAAPSDAPSVAPCWAQ